MDPRFAGASFPAAVGDRRTVYLPTPAAGAHVRYTLPSGAWYLIDSFSVQWVISAQVETGRRACFEVRDGDGNIMWQSLGATPQKVSSTYRYSFAPGISLGASEATFIASIPIPEVLLPAGWSIGTGGLAIQTEDQISQARLVLQERFDYAPMEASGHRPHPEHHARVLAALVELVDGHGGGPARQ